MNYRSWLIVAGDSEEMLGNAVSTGADIIVVDLADTVSPHARTHARQMAGEWLGVHRRQITGNRLGRWVRISALETGQWRDDLLAVMRGAPDGIILPRSAGPQTVQQLAAEIYEQEQVNHLVSGSTKIIPQVGETAHAAMTIGSYLDASLPRLAGLAWNADSLASALNTSRQRVASGPWSDTFSFVRAQLLLTAHARGIVAIDMLQAAHKDLKASARDARSDGFTGMLALLAEQVPVINEAFTPSETELSEARAIVAAHDMGSAAAAQQSGQAHLKLARRTLGLDDSLGGEGQQRPSILRSA